jgi:hypothetical protein
MSLGVQGLHFLPMGIINMSIHSEHTAQDLLDSGKEILSKFCNQY